MTGLAEVLGNHWKEPACSAFDVSDECSCGWAGLTHPDHLAAVVAEWLTSDEAVGVIEDALADRGVNDLVPEDSAHIAAALAEQATGGAA